MHVVRLLIKGETPLSALWDGDCSTLTDRNELSSDNQNRYCRLLFFFREFIAFVMSSFHHLTLKRSQSKPRSFLFTNETVNKPKEMEGLQEIGVDPMGGRLRRIASFRQLT